MDEQVNDDKPGLVKLVTVQLWQATNGALYNDESSARYASCTHRKCGHDGCSEYTPRHFIYCAIHSEERKNQRHAERKVASKETQYIYSDVFDKYYFDEDDVLFDDCHEAGILPSQARLLTCEPCGVRPIDANDYCHDELPEEMDAPDEVWKAAEAFNEAVKGVTLSWFYGKEAIDCTSLDDAFSKSTREPTQGPP